jgi:hypothetical protein
MTSFYLRYYNSYEANSDDYEGATTNYIKGMMFQTNASINDVQYSFNLISKEPANLGYTTRFRDFTHDYRERVREIGEWSNEMIESMYAIAPIITVNTRNPTFTIVYTITVTLANGLTLTSPSITVNANNSWARYFAPNLPLPPPIEAPAA